MPDVEEAYNVDAESSGGSTEVDVRNDPTSPHEIVARSSGGGVNVAYA